MFSKLIVIIFLWLPVYHPVHLTVTNLEFSDSQGYFEAKIRFFADDFQKILYIKYGVKPDFSRQTKEGKILIRRYLTENFRLWANGRQIPVTKYQIRSYNLQDITLWVTVRIPCREKLKNLKIENKLMTDLYTDQSNLLIFTMRDFQKAFTFNKKHTVESISF